MLSECWQQWVLLCENSTSVQPHCFLQTLHFSALQSYFLNYKPLVLSGGRSFDFWVSEWLLPPWCLFYLQYSLSFLEQPLPKFLLVILPSMWRRFTPGTRLMSDELIHSHFETIIESWRVSWFIKWNIYIVTSANNKKTGLHWQDVLGPRVADTTDQWLSLLEINSNFPKWSQRV